MQITTSSVRPTAPAGRPRPSAAQTPLGHTPTRGSRSPTPPPRGPDDLHHRRTRLGPDRPARRHHATLRAIVSAQFLLHGRPNSQVSTTPSRTPEACPKSDSAERPSPTCARPGRQPQPAQRHRERSAIGARAGRLLKLRHLGPDHQRRQRIEVDQPGRGRACPRRRRRRPRATRRTAPSAPAAGSASAPQGRPASAGAPSVVLSSHCAPTLGLAVMPRPRGRRPRRAGRRPRSRRAHSTARQTAKMIQGATAIRSLPVISPPYAAVLVGSL